MSKEITEQEKLNKIEAIRAKARDIEQYGKNVTAYCAYISCWECPMNVAPLNQIVDIVCLCNVDIVR